MDQHTAKRAIQLQLEDIADLLNSLYDEGEPEQGDERASLQTIQHDLQQQLTLVEGQVLVINILKDEYSERVALKKLLDDEKQSISNLQLAMRLAGMSILPSIEEAAPWKVRFQQRGGCATTLVGTVDRPEPIWIDQLDQKRVLDTLVASTGQWTGLRSKNSPSMTAETLKRLLKDFLVGPGMGLSTSHPGLNLDKLK
ncbi:hypothetical protein N0V91_008922 [Didymella pomorum]|uniref:Uncharacterized protein n=1 Tax=Didymella pomorum TaxID=749634 RepID=A0A9W8Z818_9PLEO|nr:hypothetical protein N0V91_008922 [Didymella pomorum]